MDALKKALWSLADWLGDRPIAVIVALGLLIIGLILTFRLYLGWSWWWASSPLWLLLLALVVLAIAFVKFLLSDKAWR